MYISRNDVHKFAVYNKIWPENEQLSRYLALQYDLNVANIHPFIGCIGLIYSTHIAATVATFHYIYLRKHLENNYISLSPTHL